MIRSTKDKNITITITLQIIIIKKTTKFPCKVTIITLSKH
jgi:hypothetical protein